MIVYNNEFYFGYGQYFICFGSAICNKRCLPQALVSGIISLLAFYYHEQVDSYFEYDHPSVYYSGLSAVMSFLLVFRGNMAYSRYWEGRTALQDMTSRLEDLGIHINSFIISEEKEAMEWKERMARFLILYYAFAVSSLRVEHNVDEILHKTRTKLEPREYKDLTLPSTNCRNYIIAGWIAKAWMKRYKEGGVDAPPPVLTRTFQIISEAQLQFNCAQKIQSTPFPFPLMQVCSLMLHIHMLTGPLVIAMNVSHPFWAFHNSFLSTLVFFALNRVAEELEDPFGTDPNDLALNHFLATFIQNLWAQGLGKGISTTGNSNDAFADRVNTAPTEKVASPDSVKVTFNPTNLHDCGSTTNGNGGGTSSMPTIVEGDLTGEIHHLASMLRKHATDSPHSHALPNHSDSGAAAQPEGSMVRRVSDVSSEESVAHLPHMHQVRQNNAVFSQVATQMSMRDSIFGSSASRLLFFQDLMFGTNSEGSSSRCTKQANLAHEVPYAQELQWVKSKNMAFRHLS